MGKKFFAAMIVAVVAMFAGYNIYVSQQTSTLSDLALANVEALANDESFGEWWDSEIYDCLAVSVWVTEYMQYKDVPREDGNWEVSTGDIDPDTWGYCTYLKEDIDCVSGTSVAHCWEC